MIEGLFLKTSSGTDFQSSSTFLKIPSIVVCLRLERALFNCPKAQLSLGETSGGLYKNMLKGHILKVEIQYTCSKKKNLKMQKLMIELYDCDNSNQFYRLFSFLTKHF